MCSVTRNECENEVDTFLELSCSANKICITLDAYLSIRRGISGISLNTFHKGKCIKRMPSVLNKIVLKFEVKS